MAGRRPGTLPGGEGDLSPAPDLLLCRFSQRVGVNYSHHPWNCCRTPRPPSVKGVRSQTGPRQTQRALGDALAQGLSATALLPRHALCPSRGVHEGHESLPGLATLKLLGQLRSHTDSWKRLQTQLPPAPYQPGRSRRLTRKHTRTLKPRDKCHSGEPHALSLPRHSKRRDKGKDSL